MLAGTGCGPAVYILSHSDDITVLSAAGRWVDTTQVKGVGASTRERIERESVVDR